MRAIQTELEEKANEWKRVQARRLAEAAGHPVPRATKRRAVGHPVARAIGSPQRQAAGHPEPNSSGRPEPSPAGYPQRRCSRCSASRSSVVYGSLGENASIEDRVRVAHREGG